ncbi:hypothetical protein JHU38_10270 [Prevotella sp. A2931]|uniref:Uncharacterized protein n=1 Tax=Prevotella illustrans TaxID=2800387 RepID=A0ABS3M7N8_9BACT|nr:MULTISPECIES: hypothetical protein [Prevotella]MBO1364145.1 hypothetical protein [Prevotella illustrans]PTL25619.1 hypothetical protein C3V39_00125 [Prevotella sp. oral taxon 820]
MKRKKYQKPETELTAVAISHFICVSAGINEWSSENDKSDDDDWSDDNSNNSKSMNLWEK